MKVILLPGASLMVITPINDGVRVRCPGCGCEQDYRGTGHRAFRHADGCPTYARIERASEQYARDEVRRG
jgi:uncharacterized protein (DUF983 family)